MNRLLKPSRWFCRHWSPWCVLDTALHALRLRIPAACDRRDEVIQRG